MDLLSRSLIEDKIMLIFFCHQGPPNFFLAKINYLINIKKVNCEFKFSIFDTITVEWKRLGVNGSGSVLAPARMCPM